MVSGSQALEKVWLFSVPLQPMSILWKNKKFICFWISETSGLKYISTIPSHVCWVFMYISE